jgi:manganese-dependent inorganic pyrophosphatase
MHELQTDGRHSVLLLLTDIMKEGSELLVVSEAPGLVEQAFDVTLTDSKVWIDGMMSRKKQVIPPLEGVM